MALCVSFPLPFCRRFWYKQSISPFAVQKVQKPHFQGDLSIGSPGLEAQDVQVLGSLPSSSHVAAEGGMRVQLAQQAQESLGHSDVVLLTERGDDGALRIGQMVTMGLPEV